MTTELVVTLHVVENFLKRRKLVEILTGIRSITILAVRLKRAANNYESGVQNNFLVFEDFSLNLKDFSFSDLSLIFKDFLLNYTDFLVFSQRIFFLVQKNFL